MIRFLKYCTDNKLRATQPRMAAYLILTRETKPITAYELLERMNDYFKNPQPPTAYRALNFLVEHKFIHRIESLNKYVMCASLIRHTNTHFLICDECGHVEEMSPATLTMKNIEDIDKKGFEITRWFSETHGTCAGCVAKERK